MAASGISRADEALAADAGLSSSRPRTSDSRSTRNDATAADLDEWIVIDLTMAGRIESIDLHAIGVGFPARVPVEVDSRPHPVSTQPDNSGFVYSDFGVMRRAVTRVFDLIVGSIVLVLSLPVFLIAALAIKLDTPGPIFFRQTRVGQHRVHFQVTKFRKMPCDLPSQGPMITLRYDSRLSRVGRFLERTKLDELPQLLNVLRGHMSIVGPRPEIPMFVEHYPEMWSTVLSVKPGLFSPATIDGRNESELYPPGDYDIEAYYVDSILPRKLHMDAKFSQRGSLMRDGWILVRGVLVAIFGAVTWRVVVARRFQAFQLGILTVLGISSMLAALMLTGRALSSPHASHALVLTTLGTPLVLLAFRIPMSHPASMSTVDIGRCVMTVLASVALVIVGLGVIGRQDVDGTVAVVFGFAFFGALMGYKILVHRTTLRFGTDASRRLSRRLVVAAFVLAPLAVVAAMIALHGVSAFTGPRGARYVILVVLAAVIRPGLLLLLPSPQVRPGNANWFMKESPRIWAASAAGSAIILMLAMVLRRWDIAAEDLVAEVLVFAAAMSAFGLWQNARQVRSADRTVPYPGEAEIRDATLLVVGLRVNLSAYVEFLDSGAIGRYRILGLMIPNEADRAMAMGGRRIVGSIADLPQILPTLPVDRVVVLSDGLAERDILLVQGIAARHDRLYVEVKLAPDLVSTGTVAEIGQIPEGSTSGR